MESLAKSEIFFLVTTIAIILITLVFVIASAYVIKILNDIKYIVKKVKSEADNVSEDIADLRDHFRNKGMAWAGMAGIAKKIFDRRRKKK